MAKLQTADLTKGNTYGESGQKYICIQMLPLFPMYIFHIKQQFKKKKLSRSQFMSDFDNFYFNKNRI